MPDPIGWLKRAVVDPAVEAVEGAGDWTRRELIDPAASFTTDVARNVAGPMQQALGEPFGFLARPLAGTEKQYIVPGGSTGAFRREGHKVPTASELESFQERVYPMAEAARGQLMKSYEPGGANREAWIRNVLFSNPGAPRDVIERMYEEQILPTIVGGLNAPVLRGSGGLPGHRGSYFSPRTGAVSIEPQGGWGTLEGLLTDVTTPRGEVVQHEVGHAARGAQQRAIEAAEDPWPTKEEKDERDRKVEEWYSARDDPYPKGWWETWDKDRPAVLRDVGRGVQDLDEALWEELWGKYKVADLPGGLSPGQHAGSKAEHRGNITNIRALLQEQRGSGEILPDDVLRLIEGGFSQPREYGGSAGAGDLGWMLKNMLKVSPERAVEILNLVSSRTPRARGGYETALTGSPGSLSSALGREWA
jgi:hypothetical protein